MSVRLKRLERAKPNFRVHLVDEATVVARGERVRVWFVRHNEGWMRAKDHPSGDLEESRADRADPNCPPGTVWQRHVELVLPQGTLLRCIVSSPHELKLSPLEYLTREKLTTRRRVRESFHIVVGNYRLKLAEPPLDLHDSTALSLDEELPPEPSDSQRFR